MSFMKTRMVKGLQYVCAGVLLGSGLLFSTGCVGVATPSGGVVYYDYDYYPDWDVYYYPAGHVYYWHRGGFWHHGPDLPGWYHGAPAHIEHFRGHTTRPWNERH